MPESRAFRWIAAAAAFAALAVLADRGAAVGFGHAMPWAARRGGAGDSGDATVYRALQTDADIVILGHSRARHDYNPDVIADRLGTTAYNAGKNGQGLWYTLGMTDLLLRESNPTILIIDIDPQSIVFNRRQHDAIAFLATHIDRSPVIRELIYGQSTLERVKYLSHSFRFNSRLVQMLATAFGPIDSPDGFAPLTRRLDPARDQDASESWGPGEWPVDPELESILIRTIEAAHARGVRVVLVTAPVWNRTGTPDPRQPPLVERIDAIARTHRVPWLRVTAQTHPVYADPALFADGTHLNEVGADAFSALVAEWAASHR